MCTFQFWGENNDRVCLRVMRKHLFGVDKLPKEGGELGDRHLLNYRGDIVGIALLRVLPAGPTKKRGAAPHRLQFFHTPSGRWLSLGRLHQAK